jgi:outer membrane lipoprotein-sorting protein
MRLRALLPFFLLCAGLTASEPAALPPAPESLVSEAQRLQDPPAEPWRGLLETLRAKENIQATFTENRFLPFKKVPVVFTGELRLSREKGLSLHYLSPQERTMVVDDAGVFMRDGSGRTREMPADARALAATSALLHVMRFDLAALEPHFAVYAEGSRDLWHFAFDPRDGALEKTLSQLVVTGQDTEVRRIVMRKSAMQGLEILIGEVQAGVTWSPDDLKRYFR